MVRNIEYINIRELLSRVLRHPLLQDFTLEQAIQYSLDFIGVFGFPELYEDKQAQVPICEYRGKLPCDLIEVIMVKDCRTDVPLRSMTDVFNPGGRLYNHLQHEPAFKIQGRVIITSFPQGDVIIAYKAIPVDDEGYPLLVDNSKYMKALELYVKCQMFTQLFDLGKVTPQVLQHTEQEYAWAAGQLEEEFKTPSLSEMQSITNMLNQIIVRKDEFYNRFERLGNKEFNRVHNAGIGNVVTGFGAPAGRKDDFTPSEAPSGGSSKEDCDTVPLTDNELNEIFGDQSQPVVEDVDALTDEELNEIFSN